MSPATIVFIRQIARLVKGIGSALDDWAAALERAAQEQQRKG